MRHFNCLQSWVASNRPYASFLAREKQPDVCVVALSFIDLAWSFLAEDFQV